MSTEILDADLLLGVKRGRQLTFEIYLGSGDHILEDVAVKERELFISDATDVYPASALR